MRKAFTVYIRASHKKGGCLSFFFFNLKSKQEDSFLITSHHPAEGRRRNSTVLHSELTWGQLVPVCTFGNDECTFFTELTWTAPGSWQCVSLPALPVSSSADRFPASGPLSAPSLHPADCEETCGTHNTDHNAAPHTENSCITWYLRVSAEQEVGQEEGLAWFLWFRLS